MLIFQNPFFMLYESITGMLTGNLLLFAYRKIEMASAKKDIFQRAEKAAFDPDASILLGMVYELQKAYASKGGSTHELEIVAIADTFLDWYKQTNQQPYLVGAHVLWRQILATSSTSQNENLAFTGIWDTERQLTDHPEERRSSLKAIIKYMPAGSEYGEQAKGRLETLNKENPETPGAIGRFLNRFNIG